MSNSIPGDASNPQQRPLFELPESAVSGEPAQDPMPLFGQPRFQSPVRNQHRLIDTSLDELVSEDNPVRAVWDLVSNADLSELDARIQAVEGGVGRNPIDPQILMALWLFATIEGVGSAREIARLTKRDNYYRWICGGVTVNRTTLAAFRTATPELFQRVLIDYTARLMRAGLVRLNRVSLDGTRVRASAGKSSFRRDPTLEELQREAETQVALLAQERESGSASANHTTRASDAADRARRVDQARQALPELAQIRESRKKGDGKNARASTTDPDARTMKMANGGFNPAFNVQFATDHESGMIVGVDTNNHGTDKGLITPMLEQITTRYGTPPGIVLVDGGDTTNEDIETATAAGVTVIAPVKEAAQKKKKGVDPFLPLPGDSAAIAAWRIRRGLDATQELYKERAATAEWVNAQARNRNRQQFRVRGLLKVKCIALWYALAHNLTRGLKLRAVLTKIPN